MTAVLPAPVSAATPRLADPDATPDHTPRSEVRSVPAHADAARRELLRPPKPMVAASVAVLLLSVVLTTWYGTRIRPEMFDVLSASLLTMLGIVPGFASLLFVDRPVLLLGGRVAVRGWISPMLVGYGLTWLVALVSALACASVADPSPVHVRVAICSSLIATLSIPLIFTALVRRLGARASTETVVAVAIGQDQRPSSRLESARGGTLLAKNLRDVAIREFDAGDRQACEERLWGLACIAVLAHEPAVRLEAVDELAFVVEHGVLHDRGLALQGLDHLSAVAARRAELRRRTAEHFVDIVAAAMGREGVSRRVLEHAQLHLDGFVDQADGNLLRRMVERAAAASAQNTRPHLDLLLRWCPRAPQAARQPAAREALLLVDRLDSAALRVDYRLALIEHVYGSSAGRPKPSSIRNEAMRLAPDLYAGADRCHPTAPLARAEVRRSFIRGTSALYLALGEAVLDADVDVPTGVVDPRGALLGEYLLAAVRAQNSGALGELESWIGGVSPDRFLRLAPAAMVALRSVRDEIVTQIDDAVPGALSEATERAMRILDELCWRTIQIAVRGEHVALVASALTTWKGATNKLALPPNVQRSTKIADVTNILRDNPGAFTELSSRLNDALISAADLSDLPMLFTVLHTSHEAAQLSSEQVRRFLVASGQSSRQVVDDFEDGADPQDEDLAEALQLQDWLTGWLSASAVEQIYRACEDWVTGGHPDLATLERTFADWAGTSHPGPALLLGVKARGLHRDEPALLTDETWQWLNEGAADLLERGLAKAVPEEQRYLTFCANTWFRWTLVGLTDGRRLDRPRVLAAAVSSGHVTSRAITSALRFRTVRALPRTARAALVPALAEAGHPFESLRLHRAELEQATLAQRTIEQIEQLIHTGERPLRTADRALREVRSYGTRALVRYVGPAPVQSLLTACLDVLPEGGTADQAELARQLQSEAELAAAEPHLPTKRLSPPGATRAGSSDGCRPADASTSRE